MTTAAELARNMLLFQKSNALEGHMARQENSVRFAHWLKTFSRWDGWTVELGGTLVLMGWLLGNEVSKRVLPGPIAMNPVTGLGFVVASVSLVCYLESESTLTLSPKCGRLPSAACAVCGANEPRPVAALKTMASPTRDTELNRLEVCGDNMK